MRIRVKGFTLIELIVVVVVIGILASISFAQYTKATERARDEEAKTALRLIKAAEKSYFLKHSGYYPFTGEESDINDINANLKLSLVETNWDYRLFSTHIAWAERINAPTGFWRILSIVYDVGEPYCSDGNCN